MVGFVVDQTQNTSAFVKAVRHTLVISVGVQACEVFLSKSVMSHYSEGHF